MKNKRTHIFFFFFFFFFFFYIGVLAELFFFLGLGIWKQTVGTLCAELLLHFYTNQFETLQAPLSESADVHVDFAISSIYFFHFWT